MEDNEVRLLQHGAEWQDGLEGKVQRLEAQLEQVKAELRLLNTDDHRNNELRPDGQDDGHATSDAEKFVHIWEVTFADSWYMLAHRSMYPHLFVLGQAAIFFLICMELWPSTVQLLFSFRASTNTTATAATFPDDDNNVTLVYVSNDSSEVAQHMKEMKAAGYEGTSVDYMMGKLAHAGLSWSWPGQLLVCLATTIASIVCVHDYIRACRCALSDASECRTCFLICSFKVLLFVKSLVALGATLLILLEGATAVVDILKDCLAISFIDSLDELLWMPAACEPPINDYCGKLRTFGLWSLVVGMHVAVWLSLGGISAAVIVCYTFGTLIFMVLLVVVRYLGSIICRNRARVNAVHP